MQIYMTTGLNKRIAEDSEFARFMADSTGKFRIRDWGDLCDEDKKLNDWALKHMNGRIVARYNHSNGVDNIYIIATYMSTGIQLEVMFCDEYWFVTIC